MSSSPTISYRLRPVAPLAAPADLTDEQRLVTGNTAGRLKVLAGPGTGKTTTLVEAVAERVQLRGVPAEQILVLTFSRRAAGELSARIARRLGLTTRESMVRTLHSYAYSVLRTQARGAGEPIPRLLAADESDQMVRELLAGHRSDGGGGWPAYLDQALGSPTFAAELREILLRAAGQGISPQRILELGRRHKRPEWVAAGTFAREYQQVSDLRQGVSGFGVALDQAELTAAALGALRRDDLLAAEQRRVRRIFVDEYQDVDPAQARLVSVLAAGADELVVFGDPDQSIYAFRGAEPTALRDVDVDATVALTASRRLPATILTATRRVAAHLPGQAGHRELRSVDRSRVDGSVEVEVFSSAAREAAAVADKLRRAHLLDGTPWKSMAVLLRAPASGLAVLARACAVAGVPVLLGGGNEVLSSEPLVAALLTVLECGVDPAALTGQVALDLMASPLGGMDALGLRRVRRSLRAARPEEGASADLLAAVLSGAPPPASVSAELVAPVLRVRGLLDIARAEVGNPVAEQVLWQLWQVAKLEPALVAAVERGGTGGQRADGTLDAVLGLFSMAADLAQRVPLAGVRAFIDQVRGHQLPGSQDARHVGDAVAVLSAHAAKGLEWELVAVMGVQEGTWPDLRARGSLLGGSELLDLAAGLPARGPSGGLLAEERRLFYVACTRARNTLVCTAVANQDLVPSRFLLELAGSTEDLPVEQEAGGSGRSADRRGLHLTDLLADLRSAVIDPATPAEDAGAAARHLAELAAAGVPGARTQDWYGLAPASTVAPPIPAGAQIRVSPSLIESLNTCALRAVLERRGGRTEPGQAQLEGIVVHAMAHGLAQGVAESDLRDEIENFLSGQHHLPPWQLARTRRGLLSMLGAAQVWVRDHLPPRRVVGSELEMDLLLPTDESLDQAPQVRLVGRVDWLSENPDGTLVVTDFKTGASVPTAAQAQANAQLAAYQTAISLGAFRAVAGPESGGPDAAGPGADGPRADGPEADSSPQGGHPQRPGGAELVYLRSGRPKVLHQDQLSESDTSAWLGSIRSAAAHLASATAWATENPRCERCPVRSSCPLQNEGRQVTR